MSSTSSPESTDVFVPTSTGGRINLTLIAREVARSVREAIEKLATTRITKLEQRVAELERRQS